MRTFTVGRQDVRERKRGPDGAGRGGLKLPPRVTRSIIWTVLKARDVAAAVECPGELSLTTGNGVLRG